MIELLRKYNVGFEVLTIYRNIGLGLTTTYYLQLTKPSL